MLNMRKSVGGLHWLWLSLLVVLVDQVVKFVMVMHILPYTEHRVFPGFKLTIAYNRGAAFSFLDSAGGWQLWLFLLISIVVCVSIGVALQRLKVSQYWLCIAFALIVGGAMGNLIDRVTLGYVIDYFLLYAGSWYWPAFNVADSCICIGAVMLIIDIMVKKRRRS